ncbi:MAG: hypothetical protein D4R84_06690 [Rhodocyclaceae bacterium]|nr:MAG: hypothetical protein D4R84_06690 [Rhodocyclaceae bacterium]
MLLQGIFRPIGLAWIGIRHRLVRATRVGRKQVELPGHGILSVDEALNFVGDTCLRTNLLTKLILDRANAGAIFEISSDNLSAVETIPFMLPNCNCEHLATLHEGPCQKIYVRKCEARSTAAAANSQPRGRRK